jgi:hypothetical protein
MRSLAAVCFVVAIGCGRKSDCERAVHHLLQVTTHIGAPGSEPKADEQEVLDQVEKMTIVRCEDEGLSAAQRDCILAMKTFEDLKAVTRCPAIAAKQPSWVLVPPADEPHASPAPPVPADHP